MFGRRGDPNPPPPPPPLPTPFYPPPPPVQPTEQTLTILLNNYPLHAYGYMPEDMPFLLGLLTAFDGCTSHGEGYLGVRTLFVRFDRFTNASRVELHVDSVLADVAEHHKIPGSRETFFPDVTPRNKLDRTFSLS